MVHHTKILFRIGMFGSISFGNSRGSHQNGHLKVDNVIYEKCQLLRRNSRSLQCSSKTCVSQKVNNFREACNFHFGLICFFDLQGCGIYPVDCIGSSSFYTYGMMSSVFL